MSMDDWLKATGKDPKSVVDEMKQIASSRIVLRFGMQELATKLNVDADQALLSSNLKAAKQSAEQAGRPIPEQELAPGGVVYEQVRFDLRMQALVGTMVNDADTGMKKAA
jgi:FKBP-type peptidyl-prolyl cis-trans isomerase (trigger factor)